MALTLKRMSRVGWASVSGVRSRRASWSASLLLPCSTNCWNLQLQAGTQRALKLSSYEGQWQCLFAGALQNPTQK